MPQNPHILLVSHSSQPRTTYFCQVGRYLLSLSLVSLFFQSWGSRFHLDVFTIHCKIFIASVSGLKVLLTNVIARKVRFSLILVLQSRVSSNKTATKPEPQPGNRKPFSKKNRQGPYPPQWLSPPWWFFFGVPSFLIKPHENIKSRLISVVFGIVHAFFYDVFFTCLVEPFMRLAELPVLDSSF